MEKITGFLIILFAFFTHYPFDEKKAETETFRTWEITISSFEDGMITIPIDAKNLIIEVPVTIAIPDSLRYKDYIKTKRL